MRAIASTWRQVLLGAQVRNKQISKRETEKLVKEVWREKSEEMKSGRSTDLADFVFAHLQKRVGIVSAVVEVRKLQDLNYSF